MKLNEAQTAYLDFIERHPDYLQHIEQLLSAGLIRKDYDNFLVIPIKAHEHYPRQEVSLEFVNRFRNAFPAGKKAGAREVHKKLTAFLKRLPEYDLAIVLTARDLYLQKQQNPTYVMKAGNFISKAAGNRGDEISSVLEEFCELVTAQETNKSEGLKALGSDNFV